MRQLAGLIYYFTLFVVALIVVLYTFFPDKAAKYRIRLLVIIVICLLVQFFHSIAEERQEDWIQQQDAFFEGRAIQDRKAIQDDLDVMKAKEKKGFLSSDDYSLYIVRNLEAISLALKSASYKSTREWIVTYYDNVAAIPECFGVLDWKDAEKTIFNLIRGEVDGDFSARGLASGGARLKLQEILAAERERLLKAKEAEFESL